VGAFIPIYYYGIAFFISGHFDLEWWRWASMYVALIIGIISITGAILIFFKIRLGGILPIISGFLLLIGQLIQFNIDGHPYPMALIDTLYIDVIFMIIGGVVGLALPVKDKRDYSNY
jgi:hypothetical protein